MGCPRCTCKGAWIPRSTRLSHESHDLRAKCFARYAVPKTSGKMSPQITSIQENPGLSPPPRSFGPSARRTVHADVSKNSDVGMGIPAYNRSDTDIPARNAIGSSTFTGVAASTATQATSQALFPWTPASLSLPSPISFRFPSSTFPTLMTSEGSEAIDHHTTLGDAPESEDEDAIYDDSDWEDIGDEDLLRDPPDVCSPDAHPSVPPLPTPAPSDTSSPPSSTPTPPPEDIDEYYTRPQFDGEQPFAALRLWHPATVLAALLVAWLHLSGHLPFRYCDTVLTVIGYILMLLGRKDLLAVLPGSLSGCFSALQVEPRFQIHPVCPACNRVFPLSMYANRLARCDRVLCKHALFRWQDTSARSRRAQQGSARPVLQFPYKSIAEQLAIILDMPGVEEAVDAWRKRHRILGVLQDIFDGRICRQLLGPDGLSFFRYDLRDTGPDGELRLGVTLGVDCVINLPFYLRYRTAYLLLAGIMPGPKEADPDQVQRYMRVLVNELLRLWFYGAVIPTPKHPKGRRVRVILVGVAFKATVESFKKHAFRTRTDAQHRAYMAQYVQCKTKADCDDFVRTYATRWSELSRLPYFDMCRMIVIDPIHNLFLGLVKMHFYHIWVQLKFFRKSKELCRLHKVLDQLELPAKLGRLPRLIGEPAGGSLTADQWLILATIIGPIVLPGLWREFQDGPDGPDLREHLGTVASAAAARKAKCAAKHTIAVNGSRMTGKHKGKRAGARKRRKPVQVVNDDTEATPRRSERVPKPTAKRQEMVLEPDNAGALEIEDEDSWSQDSDDDGAGDEDINHSTSKLHPRDLDNFLKLAEALSLYLSEELTDESVAKADALLREYCTELLELYGPAVIRPNHHYATHTGDFVLDYGPLHEFLMFVFKRLNKVLKSFKTTGRSGVRLHHMLVSGLKEPSLSPLRESCDAMLTAASDDRGTLQGLAQDLEDAHQDDGIQFTLSVRASREHLAADTYHHFIYLHQTRRPLEQFHSILSLAPSPTSILVPNIATSFDYAVIHGHRYHASQRSPSSRNSLALIRTSNAGSLWAGEVMQILLFEHGPVLGSQYLASMRWFRPSSTPIAETPWSKW
ncbi:hypothetical protein LXA43DRAFT_1067338 [Ganoderma leucocontextum]|nr:hypothetical protein LXA43DRAFT_1067338 [Ganoderma leucocontextum]